MSYISQITLPNNSSYYLKDKELHYYTSCSTAADTATKSVTISGFTLVEGVKVTIAFTYANTAAAPSLSINSGTAVSFYLNKDNITLWEDGETVEFIYDGTYWNIINYDKIEVIRL